MSDKVRSLTIILESDMRDEDALALGEAIKWMKGVHRVKAGPALTAMDYINRDSVKQELIKKLFDVLEP